MARTSIRRSGGMLDLALDLLAVRRITRLITRDRIMLEPRSRVIAWSYGENGNPAKNGAWSAADWHDRLLLDDDPPMAATLVTCHACVSIWAALGVVIVRRCRWWPPVRDLLALSAMTILIEGIAD